jgi:hypothetical protein
MTKLDARIPIVALHALLIACGNGSRQPEAPAAVPAPAAQPSVPPPSAPDPKAQPKVEPRDSGGSGTYPWQSAPIAAL